MNFYSPEFLTSHSQTILDFYDQRVVDKTGGFFQNYYDDGEIFNTGFRQLVSSTRIIVNYAMASIALNKPEYADIARHGLNYLENAHWQQKTQTYAWTIHDHKPSDMTQQAYGYAFVLLAYAAAKKANIITSNAPLLATYDLLEQRFWLSEYGLYADEINVEGVLSEYRGQNANMHLCEAMIAAYEATNEMFFLDRALLIAENIVKRQASHTNGLIWEHYQTNFLPDWQYNKNDPKNLYRPWGFQPGHQTEWSKLLLMLHRHRPSDWLVESAKTLFDRAMQIAWDDTYGGLIYGFDPEEKWCDDDKYFWVQAESFAAAALLYQTTKDEIYLEHYNNIWQYSWQNMIDHQYGAWFRLLSRSNQKYSNEKSLAGAKCDYHSLGACLESLRTFSR